MYTYLDTNLDSNWNEVIENETFSCRSTAVRQNMGVNSHSIFGAQGDLSDDKLTNLPVLQNTYLITQERYTTPNEQLSSSNSTMNWDMESNYLCPTVNNNYVHLTDCVLPDNSSSSSSTMTTTTTTTMAMIPNPSTTKLNNESDIQHDGMSHATQSQSINTIATNKQNFTDLNGSKVIRLVRAKQATKRKSSLDTLIEVVQKELLRVNGQSNSNSSPPSSPPSPQYCQTRSTTTTTTTTSSKQSQPQIRPLISTVLPSSSSSSSTTHSTSLTSQLKPTRKRLNSNFNHTKRIPSNRHRTKSGNHDDITDDMDLIDDEDLISHHDEQQSNDPIHNSSSSTDDENIDEIVRDTVDRLVAITLLNNAPFIVNMITGTSGNNANTTQEIKPSINPNTMMKSLSSLPSTDYYRNDLALLSSTASELRNSMQQTSPVKQPIILQSNPSSTTSTIRTEPIKPSTVFVTPRIFNFQAVVPKPTTNIQIGNTKIILVSPTATTTTTTTNNPPTSTSQQPTLTNNSPVKLVKLTSTLPKNVQIVIPSRTSNESLSTIRPLSTLATCAIDQIPQAAQEVTITTSPNFNKPRRRSSSTTPTDKPVGKILRPVAKVLPVYSSNNSNSTTLPSSSLSSTLTTSSAHDETIKPITVHFQQRTPTTHGPMIYRMTSANPSVPVFHVRAATTSTMKTDTKPISIASSTSMCYDPKQTSNPTTTGGSVSVLACIKTTKKRTKERAIMPRPSATDSLESSHDLQQQRLNPPTVSSNPTTVPLMIPSQTPIDDLSHGNSSIFASSTYHPQSTSSRLSDNQFLSVGQQNDLSSQSTTNDKSIQCINNHENSTDEQSVKNSSSKKRNGHSNDDSWTVAADTLLRNVLSQYGFRFLDVHCQQNLSAKFDLIQANLVSGMISSKDEFYQSVLAIKEHLLENGLSKISADNLEKLFHYFEVEYPKISDGDFNLRSNDRKRTRRQ